MAKARPAIPRATKEAVLNEFNHRCAICGADRPHLHHIDENPENNNLLNLLPLCPNHHLTDQHNPTRRHEAGILRLFRRHKDPAILKPQFTPLFARTRFLELEQTHTFVSAEVHGQARELLEFVAEMEMGKYYAKKLQPFVFPPNIDSHTRAFTNNAQRDYEEGVRLRQEAYIVSLQTHREEVFHMIVELLRYQNWPEGHNGQKP